MIRITCSEHPGNEFSVHQVQHFGSELNIKIDTCEMCINDALNEKVQDDEVEELEYKVEILEEHVESLESIVERQEGQIDFLWTESRELKWRKTAETKIKNWKTIIANWKTLISNFKSQAENAKLEKDRAMAIINQVREESEIKEQEYKLKIRKLQFDLDVTKKENESLCGTKGKLKRQVDL